MTAPVHPPLDPVRLRPRWRNLAEAALGLPRPAADARFDALVAAYAEPHRAYHTLGHVAEMLARLAGWRWRLRDWPGVELAVWLHDAVYQGRPGEDERASAARLADLRDALPRPRPVAARAFETAERLILSTIDHRPEGNAADDRLFLDADLEILAAPQARYDAYAAAIRAEYAHIPDDLFRAGRAKVLDALRARGRIYLATPDWEAPARANLARERAALGA